MIITTSVSVSTTLRPGKLPSARPYPAGIAVASTIAVAPNAYSSELPIHMRKMWSLKPSRCFHASAI